MSDRLVPGARGEMLPAALIDPIGMSDLLSPIYVVFEENQADAFWGLVGVMRIMVSPTFH